MEIPIYLFTGFLESGKTTVINSTIMQEEFVEGLSTLLIVCEEGMEEYDLSYLESHDVDLVMVNSKEDFTSDFLKELDYKYVPDQIMIEYNGTWEYDIILELELPENWMIAETVSTIDGSSFEQQMKNMRSIILEQIFDSDLIIINRCNEESPKANYRRTIKAVNRKAQIIFEMENGEIDNTVTNILPFDINDDNIVIDDDDYGIWYLDALDFPDKYVNKEITFRALAYRGKGTDEQSFIPGRFTMTCCEDDVAFFGFLCKSDSAIDVSHRDWVMVTAIFKHEYSKEYNKEGPVLYLKSVESAKKPEEDLVYLT